MAIISYETYSRICGYPEKTMTRTEFEKLPQGCIPTQGDVFARIFGSHFRCRESNLVPNIPVVAEVVRRRELKPNQLDDKELRGTDRAINRYRVVFTD